MTDGPGPNEALDTHRIQLPELLTIREAADFQATLLGCAASTAPVELQGELLTRVDAAGLQLLAALVHQRQQAGLSTRWRGIPDHLMIAAERLGLSALLGLTYDQQF